MTKLTTQVMRAIFPRAPYAVIEAFVSKQDILESAGLLKSINRLNYFFSNIEHECGGFALPGLTENINYTPQRMAQVWPRRFSSAAAVTRKYGSSPGWQKGAFDDIYGGRMGNAPGTNDGSLYIGRGGPQWTGRDGYAALQRFTGIQAVDHPQLAGELDLQPEVCVAFWRWKNLNRFADADDFTACVKAWNGGTVGMPDRRANLAANGKIIAGLFAAPAGMLASDQADYSSADPSTDGGFVADDGPAPMPKPDHLPPPADFDKTIVEVEFTPLPGTVGDARVFYAQTRLKTFNISPGVIDGKWGGATAAAMARFINDRNRTDIDAPTSFPEFLESFSETFPELRKASIEGWRVKVTEERKEAKPEVVAQVAPEVVPTQKAESVSTWAGFGAAIAAVWAAVKDYLEQAWNLLTDYKDSGIWNAVADRAASVPVWLWFAGGAGILLFIASQSKQAREISTQGVKSGERV